MEAHTNQTRFPMKQTLLLIISFLAVFAPASADIIMLRNGSEINCIVNQVRDDKVLYQINKKDQMREIGTTDLYMIKFDTRGNLYITPDGKRITGETVAPPKGVDLIYLVTGAEIPAYNLTVEMDGLHYFPRKPDKKSIPTPFHLERKDVFKIKYADGYIDVITNLFAPAAPAITEEAKPQKESAPDEELNPQDRVIFHKTESKETLNSIAKRYDVTPEEIMEWNSLSSRISKNSYLKPGMELMIYTKVK